MAARIATLPYAELGRSRFSALRRRVSNPHSLLSDLLLPQIHRIIPGYRNNGGSAGLAVPAASSSASVLRRSGRGNVGTRNHVVQFAHIRDAEDGEDDGMEFDFRWQIDGSDRA